MKVNAAIPSLAKPWRWLVVPLLSLVLGCPSDPSQISIQKVSASIEAGIALDKTVGDQLTVRLREWTDGHSKFKLDADAADSYKMVVRIGASEKERPDEAKVALRVFLQARSPAGAGTDLMGKSFIDTLGNKGDAETIRAGWAVALEQILMQHQALDSVPALLALLKEPESLQKRFALGRLARFKTEEVAKALCTYVQEESDAGLVERAVGALSEIGLEVAAPTLIGLTRRRDSAFVATVVYALGNIGGREAQAYLVTMASGHPHPGVQAAAKEALKDLESRGATQNPH